MLIFVLLFFVSFSPPIELTPICHRGIAYKDGSEPSNQSITQKTNTFACNFLINYKLKNITACSFEKVIVRVGFETLNRKTTIPKEGECFYGSLVFNKRYLKCRCNQHECNSHMYKMRSILDSFWAKMKHTTNETGVEQRVLQCIEQELVALSLLPPRIEVTASQFLLTQRLLQHWVGHLTIAVLGLIVAGSLYCGCKKCCSKPKKVRYDRWNAVDPIDRGIYMPVPSKESIGEDK